MREIEFRIRHRDKEWFYGVPLTQMRNGTVGFKSFNNDYYDLFADAETLGQFTGLKDKNGAKVYEGDIIRCKVDMDLIVLVEWSEVMSAFVIREPNKIIRYCDLCFAHNIEVIGNIYDNPELIKESE